MKLRLISSAIGMFLAILVLAPAGAMATSEFGDSCTANRGTSGTQITLFGLNSASPLPLAAPSAGVITAWKLNLITPPPPENPIPQIVPQTLKVMRLNTAAKSAQVIGESSGTVGSGLNTVAARISVQAGDRLALFGSGKILFEGSESEVGTLYCGEGAAGPGDIYGGYLGNQPVGGIAAYEEGAGARVPAVAVLEADADNDGFGDETQDACPQSATTQVACPVVKLSGSTTVGKKLVTVALTSTAAATVTVNGKVSLGKGKKVKLSGGKKQVVPGSLTKFKLKFPAKLIKRLKELPPSKKLTLKITSTAPNLAAAPTKKVIKAKLKGQGSQS